MGNLIDIFCQRYTECPTCKEVKYKELCLEKVMRCRECNGLHKRSSTKSFFICYNCYSFYCQKDAKGDYSIYYCSHCAETIRDFCKMSDVGLIKLYSGEICDKCKNE